jgi:hypothetical protein
MFKSKTKSGIINVMKKEKHLQEQWLTRQWKGITYPHFELQYYGLKGMVKYVRRILSN